MNKIHLESPIIRDRFTEFVCNEFDIQERDKVVTEVPTLDMSLLNNNPWNILLIVGNSGSGKSTILKALGYKEGNNYDYSKPIVSQFPHLSEDEVCSLFCSVGLSSVPIWFHKPNELSNGERARFDICAAMANAKRNEITFIDEFTSVVNRDVAKSMSFALQRFIRANKRQIIIASCHFDIIDWLQPDYVFNLNNRDKNGDVEFEHLVYTDDESFNVFKPVNPNDVLSEPRNI